FYRAYDVESYVLRTPWKDLLHAPLGDPKWSSSVRQQYLDLPHDPRYRQLAGEAVQLLREDLRSDPLAQALAVSEWLGKNGVYSTKSNHAGNADPVADFLFGDGTGYCIYFAHS